MSKLPALKVDYVAALISALLKQRSRIAPDNKQTHNIFQDHPEFTHSEIIAKLTELGLICSTNFIEADYVEVDENALDKFARTSSPTRSMATSISTSYASIRSTGVETIETPKTKEDFDSLAPFDQITILEAIMQEIELLKILEEIAQITYDKKKKITGREDWKFITDSDEVETIFPPGFYASVWLDELNDRVVISAAGTNLSFYSLRDAHWTNLWHARKFLCDLASDYSIATKQTPQQFEFGMKIFLDILAKSHTETFEGKSVLFTGHSLGGALSSSACVYASAKYAIFKNSLAYTFESPGIDFLVKNILLELNNILNREELSFDEFASKIMNFRAAESNFVNSCNQHFGYVFQVLDKEFEHGLESLKYFLPTSVYNIFCRLYENYHTHVKKLFSTPIPPVIKATSNSVVDSKNTPDKFIYFITKQMKQHNPHITAACEYTIDALSTGIKVCSAASEATTDVYCTAKETACSAASLTKHALTHPIETASCAAIWLLESWADAATNLAGSALDTTSHVEFDLT